MTRTLLPAALLLALVGYFGPWVNHPVAGLVITGLDLGEYVKFLPVVRSGEVSIWRVGFYIPLMAISATSLLYAYHEEWASRWVRYPLLALAGVAAFNLVPPAWTPARLLEAEFRVQTASLIILLLGVAFAPFLGLVPHRLAAALSSLLLLAAIILPLHGFFSVLPAIRTLYNRPLSASWGLWLMVAALTFILIWVWRVPAGPRPEQARR